MRSGGASPRVPASAVLVGARPSQLHCLAEPSSTATAAAAKEGATDAAAAAAGRRRFTEQLRLLCERVEGCGGRVELRPHTERLAELYAAADVVVVPSRRQEPLRSRSV